MRYDLDESRAFLADWDAHRANRAKIARDRGMNRSHAYEVADRCREKIAAALIDGDAEMTTSTREKGPQPSS